jgi:hypothetical protein
MMRGRCVAITRSSCSTRLNRACRCRYEIENSTWLRQACEQKLRNYPRWRECCENNYHHNVIQGQDNYYEIIAAGYSEKRISYDAGELKRLVDEG